MRAVYGLRVSYCAIWNLQHAHLRFEAKPDDNVVTLLAVATLALRRVGSDRNRGKGYVQCQLFETTASCDSLGKEITADLSYIQRFGVAE